MSNNVQRDRAGFDVGKILNKVPQITIYFWIIKILTTAMGESTSDYLIRHIDKQVAVALGAIGFVMAMFLQFSKRKYVAWVYWMTVVMVAIFGTMVADVLRAQFGISHLVSTVFFACSLVVIFAFWYAVEKTLSIHTINTRRREIFYWLTVLTTFALGTSAGDLAAGTMKLGYLSAGLMFALLIFIVTVTHYVAKGIMSIEHKHLSRNAVFAYWVAYILTRPFGASFADWFAKVHKMGGLGYGDGNVSFILGILIVSFVFLFGADNLKQKMATAAVDMN